MASPAQRPERPQRRRPPGLLAREEVLELGRKAREAIFPAHESEIGLMRHAPSVVHGVVSAAATAALRPQWAAEGTASSSPRARASRRRRSIHCGGVRFREPHLSKASPKNPGKHKKSLAIAVPPAGGDRGGGRRGSLSARGVAGEAAGGDAKTPTSALSSAMNRALRLRGPDAGPASPISKAANRQLPLASARAAAAAAPRALRAQVGSRGDVYRYLGDAGAQGVGEGEDGVDRFLQDAYGLGDGKFRAYGGPSGFAPDAARVLGRILGFPGDLIRPTSLLAHACFVCSHEAGGLNGEADGVAECSSLVGPARALQGRGKKLKQLLDVWEQELAIMYRKACVDVQKMIQDLHFWPSWYDDLSESDRKNMCNLLAQCDLVFRATFVALDGGESKYRAQVRWRRRRPPASAGGHCGQENGRPHSCRQDVVNVQPVNQSILCVSAFRPPPIPLPPCAGAGLQCSRICR